jgi:ribosomal-protein-alanine N-acetyltransferase
VVVGAMRRRHLRAVLQIEQQVYPQPWSLGVFLSELTARATRVYLVARVGDRIVGYLGMFLSQEDAHITTIAVDPEWRRHQVGTRLMAAAARAAVARGCRNLTLEVRVSNNAAQNLYRQFGFAPAGVRPKYYPDNFEDALIMWAHDIDSAGYARRLAEIDAGVTGDTYIDRGWL